MATSPVVRARMLGPSSRFFAVIALVATLLPESRTESANAASVAPRVEGIPAQLHDSGWWGRAEQTLANREYQPSKADYGLQAPNRANDFRVLFEERGISLRERNSVNPSVLVEMSLQSIGDGTESDPVVRGVVSRTSTRVEIRRPNLVEWYTNSASGLEQGFTIFERPGDSGTIALDLGLQHATAVLDGETVLLSTDAGRQLQYSKLVALDARGKVLRSQIEVPSANVLRLVVDDAAATYPIVIDPLISAVPDHIVQSDRTSTSLDPTAFGRSIDAAGDVNGDGFDDLIVGAPGWDGGFSDEGAAFVFLGSASGILGTNPSNAHAVIQSRQAGANFGTAVAGAGDVNNDGYDDIMVGSPHYRSSIDNGTLLVEGAVFVFLGSAGGVTATDTTTANAWIQNDAMRNAMNSPSGLREPFSAISTAGDVNRDGFDDIVIGVPDYGALFEEPGIPSNQRQGSAGIALVYHGGPNGIVSVGTGFASANALIQRPPVGRAKFEGTTGASVSTAGDVNGDGFDDIVIGSGGGAGFADSPDDMLSVFLGSPTGIVGRDPDHAHAVIRGDALTPLGLAVSEAGDVNGDGFDDIVTGSYPATAGDPTIVEEGAVLVFLGGPAGSIATSPAGAQATFRGSISAELLGNGVGSADVDHDGFSDIIATARVFPGSLNSEGVVYVLRGSASGIVGNDLDDAYARIKSGQSGGAFVGGNYAFSGSGIGDVNGDGFGDVAAGFGFYDDGQVDEGAVLVFHGGPSGGINQPPVAVPGQDQVVVDTDNNSTERVTLDGGGSFDPDGTIVAYRWTEGETVLGTSAVLTTDLGFGLHPLVLTVTDDDGRTAAASVSVRVNPVPSLQRAGDPFETGNFVGGFGNWVGGWTTTGNAAIVQGGAFSVPYQARIGAGASSISRTLTLGAGATGIELRYWGRANGFAAADEVQVKVRVDGGPSILLEQITNPSSTSYQFRDLNYSWYPSTRANATVTFESSTSAGQFFIDSIVVRALAAPLANQPPPPPPTPSAISLNPTSVPGGSPSTATVTLSAAAPAGGTAVTVSDTSSATSTPSSVTIPAGSDSASFSVATTSVSTTTSSDISATAGGVTRSATLTVTAAPPPTPGRPSLLSPSNDARPNQPVVLDWSDASNATSYEVQIDTSSSFSAPLTANPTVTESTATVSGLPGQRVYWRVRARNSAGVFGSFSSSRSFTPSVQGAAPSLASLTISPASVTGGSSSIGTVTLSSPAPSGGAVVTLSDTSAVVTVPSSVTVPSGATNATFSASTSTVTAATTATISATYSGVTRTASLTVSPAGAGVTLTVTATGRSGSRLTSTPAGIDVLVGNTASATFASGTSIRLTVSGRREAVWSGACSSGGNESRSCTFTIVGSASVTGNVD